MAIAQSERPEVRRRPQEDDAEEHERRPVQTACDSRPASHGRYRAGRAADHDVLRAAALQPHRVDEHVEEQRPRRKQRRGHVHADRQYREAGDPEEHAEQQRVGGLDHACGDRPVLRTIHDAVDVAIDVAVDRVRAAGRERAAEERQQDQPSRGPALLREDHGGYRRHQQEHDDARLRERQVSAQYLSQGATLGCDDGARYVRYAGRDVLSNCHLVTIPAPEPTPASLSRRTPPGLSSDSAERPPRNDARTV